MRRSHLILCMICSLTMPTAQAADVPPTTQPAPATDTLRVACVQFDITADLNENAARIIAAIEKEHDAGTRLVVFSECALSSYDTKVIEKLRQPDIDAALGRIAAACDASDLYAVVGSAYRRDGRWYNGAFVYDPDGELVIRYDKLFCVKSFFADGDRLAILRIDGIPCTLMICHDERYPELVRIPVLAGAKFGIYTSCESKTARKWDNYRSQIMARAVENGISIVHCNAGDGGSDGGSHGHSRVIAPGGDILAEAGTSVNEVIRATLQLGKSSNKLATRAARSPAVATFWAEGLRLLRQHNPDYFAAEAASQPITERP